jgi:dephospho-CoA kinase
MRRVAIAGGIGSGKTTVTDYLGRRGFGVIDADVVAREVVAPGQPALGALVDAFGNAILTADGVMDREFVASVVFHDASALSRLNRITHAAIGEELRAGLDSATGDVVFVALPLLRPEHRQLLALDEVWVVQVAPDVAIERLCTFRGFSKDDARARLAAQPSNEERASLADEVINNDSTPDHLLARIDALVEQRGWSRGL